MFTWQSQYLRDQTPTSDTTGGRLHASPETRACTEPTAKVVSVPFSAYVTWRPRKHTSCPPKTESLVIRLWAPTAVRGSAPGIVSCDPGARRIYNLQTTRRRPPSSVSRPSRSPGPCSTASPPPGSCACSCRALLLSLIRNHRSETNHRIKIKYKVLIDILTRYPTTQWHTRTYCWYL